MLLDFPATARNRDPILKVLQKYVTPEMRVLEVASGSGQHAAFLASRLKVRLWQPTDSDLEYLASIDGYSEQIDVIQKAIKLDVNQDRWPNETYQILFCANMIHISPWESTLSLFKGASECLEDAGKLILYGPFFEADVEASPSNLSFDDSLQQRDPEWGIRVLEQVDEEAEKYGFKRVARHAMPAHNLTVVYQKEL